MPKFRIPHRLEHTFYKPEIGKLPYVCEKCGKRFAFYKELHAHKTKAHAY